MTQQAVQAPPEPAQQPAPALQPSANAFCDSCKNAAHDEAGFDIDPLTEELLLLDMGADIADHLCDQDETAQPCLCACNRRHFR